MSVKTVPGALDILNQKLGGNAGDIPASSTKEYALEKIYRTLGGEESLEGVNTTSEIIEKIAGVAQGGGGSSDFSTAEVTVRQTTGTDYSSNLALPLIVNNNLTAQNFDAEIMPESVTVTVALLNGKCVVFSRNATDYGVSGNIEYDSNAMGYVITGNCVISITAINPA